MICSDSRQVIAGSLFVAVPGVTGRGDDFIGDAVKRGARVIIREPSGKPFVAPPGVWGIEVKDVRGCLLALLKRFYEDPSRRVRTVGITGTNGKTTITYLLESIFARAGRSSGIIGTIGHRFKGKQFKAANTTPGLVDNYRYLAEMADQHVEYCLMEVSSHALEQGRVDGIEFCSAVFTNLTSDHLDYHKDREAYFGAKAKLFLNLSADGTAIVNTDDPYGKKLAGISGGKITSYGIDAPADVMAVDIDLKLTHSTFVIKTQDIHIPVETKLIGRHNVYNIVAAAAVCLKENIAPEAIAQGVAALAAVPGRLEQISEGQDFHVYVDYAHTEDALKNVLTSLRRVTDEKILVVFGCGGDRDRTKRPLMGKVACQLADQAILTNDNPRSEEPLAIIREIAEGFDKKNYEIIADRTAAIQTALGRAQKNEVVLIAGKGHEDYQIFKDKTITFNERDIVRSCLRSLPSKK